MAYMLLYTQTAETNELLSPTFVVPLTIIPSFIYFSLFRSVRSLYPNDEKESERLELSLGEMAFLLANFDANRVNPNNPIDVSHLEMFAWFRYASPLNLKLTDDFVLRLVSFPILLYANNGNGLSQIGTLIGATNFGVLLSTLSERHSKESGKEVSVCFEASFLTSFRLRW